MYKHAKYYKEVKQPYIEETFELDQLRLHITNKYKGKFLNREIDAAFDRITKGQKRRFNRYGKNRIPPPIKELISILEKRKGTST